MTRRLGAGQHRTGPIDARYRRGSAMASAVLSLVIDLRQFIGCGLRSRARLAAENLFLRKQ
jgi:hypothetical protein